LPGVDLASARLLILLLFLIWLFQSFYFKRKIIWRTWIGIFLIGFLLVIFISLFQAREVFWGLRKFVYFFSIFPLYFLVLNWFLVKSELVKKRVNQVILIITLASLPVALIGLFQFFAQFVFGSEIIKYFWAKNIVPVFCGANFGQLVVSHPSWWVEIRGKALLRTFSIFSDPHMLSFYLGLVLPIFVACFWFKKEKLFWTGFVLLFLALCLTFSRGGYLGLIGSFLVLSSGSYFYLKEKKLAFVLLFCLLIFIMPGTWVSERFYSIFNLSEGSNLGRLEMWQKAWLLFKERPFFGVGLGNYALYLVSDIGYRNPITAHNLYLEILSETGVFGLLIWLVLFFGLIKNLFSCLSLKKKEEKLLPLGLISSFAYFLIHSFFEISFYHPVILSLLMIFFAVGTVLIDN